MNSGDARIVDHFRRLQAQTAGLLDGFLCVDTAHLGFRALLRLPQHIAVSRTDAQALLAHRYRQFAEAAPAGEAWAFVDLLFMPVIHRLLETYSYVWLIEYDVDFSGHWRDFFADAMPSRADLLASTIQARAASPAWPHWDRFACPDDVAPDRQLRAFLPIARFSRAAIDAYVGEIARGGWQGHQEATIPTAAYHRGLAVEDLGGNGPFVPVEWRGRHYTNAPADPGLTPETFRFRPAVSDCYFHENAAPFSAPDRLYHPVKTAASR